MWQIFFWVWWLLLTIRLFMTLSFHLGKLKKNFDYFLELTTFSWVFVACCLYTKYIAGYFVMLCFKSICKTLPITLLLPLDNLKSNASQYSQGLTGDYVSIVCFKSSESYGLLLLETFLFLINKLKTTVWCF